ncbi:MAG: GyrI-like domain-containing protein [Bauldia sp.]|nr:GyrI-like domain-containing protein [Bauldia sp.]MCW5719088.1 GyrI-like domain-containing protein [Bauldia sp.]
MTASAAKPSFTIGPASVVTVAAQPVALVSRDIGFAEIPATQQSASALVNAATKAQDVGGGAPFTRFAMLPGGGMRYEPGSFVSGPFKSDGDVKADALPAGRAAHLTLKGDFSGLAEAWPALMEWAASEKLGLAGVNWEVYAPNADLSRQETRLYTLLA